MLLLIFWGLAAAAAKLLECFLTGLYNKLCIYPVVKLKLGSLLWFKWILDALIEFSKSKDILLDRIPIFYELFKFLVVD